MNHPAPAAPGRHTLEGPLVNPASGDSPEISIIIPTHGRPAQLAACLETLTGLEYPRDRFEVIIVDDGSGTPPATVVDPLHGRLNVTFVSQPHAGPATARNTGAARARGKFLAFTDDDCAPAADWLQKLADRLGSAPENMIGGRTVNALADNLYAAASQLLIDYLYDYYNTDANQAGFFTSNNMAMAARLFAEVGRFDSTFPQAAGEDRDLCDRWRGHGFKMTFAPEVVVRHAHRLTVGRFCRQHFNYGRAAYHFHQQRARRGSGRIRVEPASFYLKLLSYPFRQGRGLRAVSLAGLLFLSQCANALGFYWNWFSSPSSNRP